MMWSCASSVFFRQKRLREPHRKRKHMMQRIWNSSGIAPVVVMVLVAISIVLAGIAIQAFVFDGEDRGDEGGALREEEPAQSTYEICLAKCRDQYGGSGSAGFDACVRACGATRGEVVDDDNSGEVERTEPKEQKVILPSPPPPSLPLPPPPPSPGSSQPLPPPPPPAPTAVNIAIQGFAYSSSTVTIPVGSTVVFTNKDSAAHTATADGGTFGTSLLSKDQSGSVTFQNVGTFLYHCTPHPWMKGTIVVE